MNSMFLSSLDFCSNPIFTEIFTFPLLFLHHIQLPRKNKNKYKSLVVPSVGLYSVFISVSLAIETVHSNLFIILLKGCKVLPSLRKLTLLHALPDIPVDKCSLGIHEIELVVQSGPGLGNGGGVGQHADSPLDLS